MLDSLRDTIRSLLSPRNSQAPAPAAPPPVTYPIGPEVLTLEVSYTCNLHCMMCPRTFDGVAQDVLPPAIFERILPDLSRFKYVHMTGYGEPLMSPHFVDYLIKVRESGAIPTVTTNGLLLKGNLARRILEEKMVHINISIDAGTADTYERVRGKGTFHQVLKTLRNFKALKDEIHPECFLEWVFIMMRGNFRELPEALAMAIDMGLNRFTAKHLECALSRAEFSEALFDTGYVPPPEMELIEELEEVLAECRRMAEGKIWFVVHPYQSQVEGMCLVKPTTYIFLDYEGHISNCCYLNRLDTRPYLDAPPEDDGLMGNILEHTLGEIMETPRYIEFQKDWMEGRIPKACNGCVQLNRMQEQPYPPVKVGAR